MITPRTTKTPNSISGNIILADSGVWVGVCSPFYWALRRLACPWPDVVAPAGVVLTSFMILLDI